MLASGSKNCNDYTDLLLRCEVVYNVEKFPDLLRSLTLDHVGYCLAADVASSPVSL